MTVEMNDWCGSAPALSVFGIPRKLSWIDLPKLGY